MKIGWVTPLATTSAIGFVSVQVCQALVERGHLVDIIRSETADAIDAPHWPTSCPVLSWRDVPSDAAEQNYDVVFLSIGDNFNFHAGIFEYLSQPFAIGIFHDFYLFNLFNGWRQQRGLTANQSVREIISAYGPASAGAALRAINGEADITELSRTVPMTEWVAQRCTAAVGHARFYLPRLEKSCAGVVEVGNLPFAGREVQPALAKGGKLTVATVGVVNPNKCVDVVIDAIGQSPLLRDKLRYVVAGPIDDATRAALNDKAEAQGVEFMALGRVEDDELLNVLNEADIMCCLRRPVLEGASASAIEAMLSGRPTIVANAGFYGELPDRYVAKVPEDFIASDLALVMEEWVADSATRLRIGAEAQAWARETFSATAYAVMLETVVREQFRLTPYLDLADRVADRLGLLGIGPSSANVARIAAAIDDMRMPARDSPHRM